MPQSDGQIDQFSHFFRRKGAMSGLNEVGEQARMALWGVAARNANNSNAGQGTSETLDREHQHQAQVDSSRFYVSPPPEMPPQQQRPQEYTLDLQFR